MTRPSSRERILDALEAMLIDSGAAAVTLDAVAEAAQVSKGGLLYHFGSRAALFEGLTTRIADQVRSAVAEAPDDPESVIRWYVDRSSPTTEDEARLYRSLLAGLRGADPADDPSGGLLRDLFLSYAAPLYERVSDPVVVEQVRLLTDGLFVGALIGIPRPADDVLDEVVARLCTQLRAPREPGRR